MRPRRWSCSATSSRRPQTSGLLYLPEQSLLLAADGDAFHPQLLRFDLSSPNARVLEPVSVSATGLPPRHLGRIRP
jgi:hypothetical protein